MKNTPMKNTIFAFLSLSTAISTMGYATDGSLTEKEVAAQIAAKAEAAPQVAASACPQANAAQQNLVRLPDDTLGHIASFLNWRELGALSQVNQALHTQQPKLIKNTTTRLIESAFQSGTIKPNALSELKKVAVHYPELFNEAARRVLSPYDTIIQVTDALSPLLVHLTEGLTPLLQEDNLREAAHKLFDVPMDAVTNWQSAAVKHYFGKKRLYHKADADAGAIEAAFNSLLDSVKTDFANQHYVDINRFLEHQGTHNMAEELVSRTTLVLSKQEIRANKDQLERILGNNPNQLMVVDLPVEESRDASGEATSERYEINLHGYELPSNIQNLAVVCQSETPIRIGNYFLQKCRYLQSLDLSPLSQVTEIGEFFLEGCCGFQALDLSPLSQVTKIGNSFLMECRGLQSLDLSPLLQVTKVGEGFLWACTSLQSLDLSPLSQLTKVGNLFLALCTSLQSLDLSPLSQLTEVGHSFIWHCSDLKFLDLSPLSQLTKVGDYFLTACTSLQSLDLSPLSQVIKVGEGFLAGSRNINSIYITNPLLAQQVAQNRVTNDLTVYIPFSDEEINALQEIPNRTRQNIQLKKVDLEFDFAAVAGDATNEAMRVLSGGGGGGAE